MEEIESLKPATLAALLDALNLQKVGAISVRGADGDEMTIAGISFEARPNGLHLLLECPEAECVQP